MKTPLISIIVPIYNMEKYLSYCLDSLMNQTYRNLEIWLIDDGSKDRSLAICQDYAARDSRFKVYHQENGGLGAARNAGLKCATGEYINFIDSDDYVNSRFIQTLYDNIVSGPYDLSLVGYDYVYDYQSDFDPAPSHRHPLTQSQLVNSLFNRFPATVSGWGDTLMLVVWNKLYKRELVEGLTFSSGTLSEDLEFNIQVFLRVRQAIFDDVALHHYFQRQGSAVHRAVSLNYLCRLESHYKTLQFIPETQDEYRGACLVKLYKTLLSTRYLMRHLKVPEDRQRIDRTISDIHALTFREFKQSAYIPVRLKRMLDLFYRFPLSYRLFVSACEVRSYLRSGRAVKLADVNSSQGEKPLSHSESAPSGEGRVLPSADCR